MNRRSAAGAGSQKSPRRRRCLPAALFRMPRNGIRAWERWRPALGKSALAYSRPSSPGACRKQEGRSRSAREAWSHPPAEDQRGATITGARVDPAGAAAIRPGAQGAVPSAEARPVSAPLPIAGSAYRPTSSKRSRAGSWLYLRPSKRGREASNATCWRLWSRPASATGGGPHDSAASGATMAHPLNPGCEPRRPHSLRSRTDVKVTESFRASRDCPGRAFHSPLRDETGPAPPQRAAVSTFNELMSRAGHASKRP